MTAVTLHNRVVLITGASGTLGAATAKACARAGASVVLLSRNIPKLEKLYDEIVSAGGQQPALYPLDLAGATAQDYADLAATLQRELGGLHGLIHCAAELGHLCPLTELAGERWQRLLHVNLSAPFLLTGALLPLLLAAQGAVVFVGDSAVGDGKAFWGAYGVAKIGLAGYARMLKAETESSGLRTEYFIPGPMRSPIRLRAYPGESLDTLPASGMHAERLLQLLGTAEPPPHS